MRMSRGGFVPYIVGLALISALAAGPAEAAGSSAPAAASDVKVAGIHIDNFGKVNDHYYRGAQPRGQDFKALAGLGIKMMIDLAAEGDQAEEANARAAGIQFVRIPMSTHQVPSPQIVTQFLSLVNDPANQPVYVHCIGGRHRTGVMTAIYRMSMEQWNWMRAFDEMKQYKYGADFLHPEFKAFIESFVPAPAVGTARTKSVGRE
jgi:protein tyrosine phosphatase (PTP) superfamily phosphohydrolase (DUF442 family)